MKSSIDLVKTTSAPAAIGPYAQAVVADGYVYTSGQIGLSPVTQILVTGGIVAETERVLANLAAVLLAAGSSPREVLKCTVFLADLSDFAAMNEIYGRFFDGHTPARSTVQVAALPKGARVEIDIVARLTPKS